MHLFLLGRQPQLGRAELESLLGAAHVVPLGHTAILVDTPLQPDFFKRLGGSIKHVEVIDTYEGTSWQSIEQYGRSGLASRLDLPPTGKIQYGISVYGCTANTRQITALGLSLKKQLQRSTRFIAPTAQSHLSSAQVLGNKLTGVHGREIVFYGAAGKTYVGLTRAEQDINAYSRRDQARPKRDSKVGMLPPKLAQMIINLASGPLAGSSPRRLLDPFCGTGVILQEAALMGFDVYGTDLEARMVEYSQANLTWLGHGNQATLAAGDATTYVWAPPVNLVASETYLGRPFSAQPAADKLMETVHTCNTIIKQFLHNIRTQLEPGTRLCLAVPAWQDKPNQFRQLPLLDQLEQMGYNYVSFEHVEPADLIYYRSDQIVGRRLIVITRK